MILTVDGQVERPLRLTFADLEALPDPAQVRDVSRFHPNRRGDGVTLDAILERAGVLPSANYLTLHADRDDFHVSVPLDAASRPGDRRLPARARPAGARAWRSDPLPDPRPVRVPHRRARRLRQRQVPEPDRADRGPRPRHATRR